MQAKGRYDEALGLRRAARLSRPDVITTGAEAALLAEMGRTEEAEALFVGAQLLHRDTAALPISWLYFQHGTMWERNGQQERARALFRAANERFPAYAHAAGHLALLEPPERAIELLRPLADGSEDPEYAVSAEEATTAAMEMFVYANDLGPFERILLDHGLKRDDSLKFISEAEHLHSTDDVYRDQFEELRYRLGIDV